MTAHLVTVPPRMQASVSSWLNQQSRKRSTSRSAPRSRSSEVPSVESAQPAKLHDDDAVSQDTLWSVLLESMRDGVLVVSRNLQPIYFNCKAKELCQQLQELDENTVALPIVVSELCQRLLREEFLTPDPLVMEYQGHPGQLIRLQVRWINFKSEAGQVGDPPLMLVLLEDCYAVLQEELALEQSKYDLTDREAEIWILLRQEYTYQEIAELLQISLNTVKTHVKNVYAKRKSLMGQRKIWYSR